ncbi:MAG: DUF402 domain-containing protein [Firmicutes bacterium]|uniref:DUF402 domain-containing protein n=1 Tax=Melghirimyces thermohalophilus TaxID=1236220 RepID=A0A1G6IFV0_9BACL|nr:DUF402 domain-containing protein [Melghirimyces thermohalophilus]MDA8352858.1 DUF402 domain-containing protein [Bacillota bacterium]SDC05344.1 hypothetical protein SAMN04488112_102217 [Melghirimyces thermohalophilus]
MDQIVRPGDRIRIESRKYDGGFHRSWLQSVVLKTQDPLLVANRDVQVTESDGSQWFTKGLAICQFHRDEWFNTIVLFDARGSYRFYCNLASPYTWQQGVLVYTDFDLDLLVEADGSYRWLDREEFEQNRRLYSYPPQLVKRIREAALQLEERVRSGEAPFTPGFVRTGYHLYLSYKNYLMG